MVIAVAGRDEQACPKGDNPQALWRYLVLAALFSLVLFVLMFEGEERRASGQCGQLCLRLTKPVIRLPGFDLACCCGQVTTHVWGVASERSERFGALWVILFAADFAGPAPVRDRAMARRLFRRSSVMSLLYRRRWFVTETAGIAGGCVHSLARC